MEQFNGQGEARWPLALWPSWFGYDRGFGTETAHFISDVISRRVMPYRVLDVRRPSGKSRTLHSPEPVLMTIQRGLLDGLVDLGVPHAIAFAYRAKRSTVDCANQHLRARTVIRLDVADFFPSISERLVFDALRAIEFPRGVVHTKHERLGRLAAYELACLMTVSPPHESTWTNRSSGRGAVGAMDSVPRSYPYKNQKEGFLPQGAPTSGALSNLVMRPADQRIYELASALGLRFSRYSDDMYFSSRDRVPDSDVDTLILAVQQVLADLGLHLNHSKTYVAGPGSRRSVLNVIVDGPAPRLPSSYKRSVDLHLRGSQRFGMDEHARHRGFGSIEDLDVLVSGHFAYARMVEPAWADPRWATWRRLRDAQMAARTELVVVESNTSAATAASVARASIDELIQGAHRYRTTSEYTRLLRFVSKFKQYAPYNAMLVDLQRRGARFVLTAERWRRDFGRVLKPGAQPLLILQPGGPVMIVYDVGDTEALPGARRLPPEVVDPIAIRARVSEDRLAELWNRTVDNAARDGIRVTLVDHAGGAAGRTYRSLIGGTISRPRPRSPETESYDLVYEVEVNRNLRSLDRYATLVHELAHLHCGHLSESSASLWPDRRTGTKARDEIEAESITFMVVARLDDSVEMGDYILGHAAKSDATMPDLALNLIFKAAGDITEMGAKRLPARKK